MKALLKLAVIAGISVTAAVGYLSQGASLATASPTAASPRGLYLQNCARCHGSDGRAQTPLGKKLDAADLTTLGNGQASITRTIRNGRGDMPAFRKKLTEKQIASIAAYVSSL